MIMNDININMLSELNFPLLNYFTQIFTSNEFTSCITKPRKITELSQISINHIITNANEIIITLGFLQCSISDHFRIFCIVFSVKPKTPQKTQPILVAELKMKMVTPFEMIYMIPQLLLYKNFKPLLYSFLISSFISIIW